MKLCSALTTTQVLRSGLLWEVHGGSSTGALGGEQEGEGVSCLSSGDQRIRSFEWFMYHAVNQLFSSPNVNSFWQVLTSSVPAAPTPELPVRPRGLLEVAKHFSN